MRGLAKPVVYVKLALVKKKHSNACAEAEDERDYILAACERARQRCNKLSDEERRRLRDKALAIIYGSAFERADSHRQFRRRLAE